MERKVVAYHELGHAIVAIALPRAESVHKVSIIPRGIGALGYTIQRPTEDRYLMTRGELLDKICVLLGGRAAEKLVFEHLSTGAADDLAKVTDIARSMVTRYGMDESLGYVVYDAPKSAFLGQGEAPTYLERRFSEDTARDIDEAVRKIVDEAFRRTIAILRQNRSVLERCAAVLLQKETLLAGEIADLTRDLVPAPGADISREALGADAGTA
jgi:cell division protease FtsH